MEGNLKITLGGDGGRSIEVPYDQWQEFLTTLKRPEITAVFDNAHGDAQTVYEQLGSLNKVAV